MFHGKMHGTCFWWHDNNKCHAICKFINGLHDGLFQDWNRNETRKGIIQWKNGDRHGTIIDFKYK